MVHHYENLQVWKRSIDLSTHIYKVLISCKDFGLKDQMQRAAVSIPSNIAEGSQRDSAKDFIRFLNIAKGSAAELNTQAIIAGRLGYLPLNEEGIIRAEIHEVLKMISGLIKKLSMSS